MRGPPLAAARLPQPVRGISSPQGIDRSHTCSVRDILNCVSKGGAAQPAGGFYVQYVPPLFPTCYGAQGSSHRASRVRIAAEQLQRPDRIHLLGDSSGDFTVAKEAPRSIKHFREDPWSNF